MVRFSDLIREGIGKYSPQEKGRKGPPAEQPGQEREAPAGPSEPISLKTLKPEQTAKPRQPDIDWYALAEAELSRLTGAVRQEKPFRLDDIAPIAAGMVEALKGSDQLVARAFSRQKGPPFITNMVNVAVISTKIGMGLGYQREQLVRLALAALVYDLGIFRLPESQLTDTGSWSAQQIDALRRHPLLGAEVLKQMAPDYPWLPDIVAQVHERANGTGYPHGLLGEQIHEFAQVIGAADVLDAIMHPRLSREARLPHEAVKEVLTVEKTGFPKQILKALAEQVSLYPLGTRVQLTTGEMGVVTRLNPRFPLRPVISVSHITDGTALATPKLMDLSKTVLVHIQKVLEP